MNFKEWIIKEDEEIASYINRAADALASMAEKTVEKRSVKRTIVILGRDAWPLVPALKHRNANVQYFLYSRLQIGDPSTKETWLREIPKNSIVVDTGYKGSIIDDIKNFDPTIDGVLLSRDNNSNYPELKIQGEKLSRKDIIDKIEHSPKLINRTDKYRGNYAIVSKHDQNDVDQRSSVTDTLNYNKKLLQDMGLPEDIIKKYTNFSGISLKQRLGHIDLVTHLMNVQIHNDETDKVNQENEIYWTNKWNKIIKNVLNNKNFAWNWNEIPNPIKSELTYLTLNILKNTYENLDKTKKELSETLPFQKEDIQSVQERIRIIEIEIKNLLKFLEGILKEKLSPNPVSHLTDQQKKSLLFSKSDKDLFFSRSGTRFNDKIDDLSIYFLLSHAFDIERMIEIILDETQNITGNNISTIINNYRNDNNVIPESIVKNSKYYANLLSNTNLRSILDRNKKDFLLIIKWIIDNKENLNNENFMTLIYFINKNTGKDKSYKNINDWPSNVLRYLQMEIINSDADICKIIEMISSNSTILKYYFADKLNSFSGKVISCLVSFDESNDDFDDLRMVSTIADKILNKISTTDLSPYAIWSLFRALKVQNLHGDMDQKSNAKMLIYRHKNIEPKVRELINKYLEPQTITTK